MANMRVRCTTMIAGAALVLAHPAIAASPEPGVAKSGFDYEQVQQLEPGTLTTDKDLDEARGGFVWFYYVVVGATAVLQTCSKVNCVQMGVTAFNTISAARQFICNRKPRLRIC